MDTSDPELVLEHFCNPPKTAGIYEHRVENDEFDFRYQLLPDEVFPPISSMNNVLDESAVQFRSGKLVQGQGVRLADGMFKLNRSERRSLHSKVEAISWDDQSRLDGDYGTPGSTPNAGYECLNVTFGEIDYKLEWVNESYAHGRVGETGHLASGSDRSESDLRDLVGELYDLAKHEMVGNLV